MPKRSSYVMETNQKDSRTTRKPKKSNVRSRDSDYHEPKIHSHMKKEKYNHWKYQIEDEGWDD